MVIIIFRHSLAPLIFIPSILHIQPINHPLPLNQILQQQFLLRPQQPTIPQLLLVLPPQLHIISLDQPSNPYRLINGLLDVESIR